VIAAIFTDLLLILACSLFCFFFFFFCSTYSDGNIIIDQNEGGVDACELSFCRHCYTLRLINNWCKLPKINYLIKFGLSSIENKHTGQNPKPERTQAVKLAAVSAANFIEEKLAVFG